MSNLKVYKLLSFRVFCRVLFILLLIAVFLLLSLITLNALKGFYNGNTLLGFIGVGFVIILIYYAYKLGSSIVLFFQYLLNDMNKTVIIDFDKNNLTVNIKDTKIEVLNDNNLKCIEYHISIGNGKNPTSDYEFIKLITKTEREFVITNLTMDSSPVEIIFPKIKSILKFNKTNYIN